MAQMARISNDLDSAAILTHLAVTAMRLCDKHSGESNTDLRPAMMAVRRKLHKDTFSQLQRFNVAHKICRHLSLETCDVLLRDIASQLATAECASMQPAAANRCRPPRQCDSEQDGVPTCSSTEPYEEHTFPQLGCDGRPNLAPSSVSRSPPTSTRAPPANDRAAAPAAGHLFAVTGDCAVVAEFARSMGFGSHPAAAFPGNVSVEAAKVSTGPTVGAEDSECGDGTVSSTRSTGVQTSKVKKHPKSTEISDDDLIHLLPPLLPGSLVSGQLVVAGRDLFRDSTLLVSAGTRGRALRRYDKDQVEVYFEEGHQIIYCWLDSIQAVSPAGSHPQHTDSSVVDVVQHFENT